MIWEYWTLSGCREDIQKLSGRRLRTLPYLQQKILDVVGEVSKLIYRIYFEGKITRVGCQTPNAHSCVLEVLIDLYNFQFRDSCMHTTKNSTLHLQIGK